MRSVSIAALLIALLFAAAGVPTVVAGAATGQSCSPVRSAGSHPVPVGDPLAVGGATNLQPDDNVIVVELRDANGDVVASNGTEKWTRTGEWCVTLPTTGLQAGRYTVEVDDGHNTVTETVRLVEATPTPVRTPTETPRPTPTLTATATDAPADTPRTTVTPTPSSTPTGTSTPTSGRGTGFGVLPVLVALALAATVRAFRYG
ncbi:MAG: hypothetical protein ABEH56_01580 [Salinirussus sp.]